MNILINFLTGFFGRTRRTEGPLRGPVEPVSAPVARIEEQLKIAAAFAAYRRLTSDCAGLRFDVRTENGIKLKRGGVLAALPQLAPFIRAANPSMSAYQYLMRVYLDLASYQCHLSRRVTTLGKTTLEPLDAAQWVPVRTSGVLEFHSRFGTTKEIISAKSYFYVTSFGDGLTGFSTSENMADAAGVANDANKAAGGIYANGLRPAGIVFSELPLGDDAVAAVRQNYQDITDGKQGKRLWLFEGGLKYQAVNYNAEDAQLLQTRRFQIEEICRFIGVPPFLVFENSETTTLGSSLEEMLNAYYDGAVKHLSTALARAIESQFLSDAEAAAFDVNFDLDTARVVPLKTRVEAYSLAIASGQLVADEARALEGRGAIPGGAVAFVQGALRPITEPYRPPASSFTNS
jgi:HK97 family phage portal protein